MKTEEIAALRTAAQAHFYPDGTPHKYGASDPRWQAYRALATPANILSLLARLDTQQKELAEARSKVTSLLEDFASDALPSEIEWCRLKCIDLGIDWPITPIPYKGALPAGDGWGPGPAAVFASPADYDASVESAVARIKSGEIQPVSACLQECSSCQKGESRTGSALLNAMLSPSQPVNPHKDPEFWGCWGNAECPCNSKFPEADCPCYLPAE